MSKFVPDSILERIRDATDIVEIISEYVPLKKAGRSYKAVCPFHEDSNPSFTVSPERQTFYCFGCAKGGDVFSFIMEHDNMSFPEAIELLGKRAGIEIPRNERPEDKGILKMYEANEWAARTYNHILLKGPEAAKARLYLEERGFDGETQERHLLGFAPSSRSVLVKKAAADRVSSDALIDAGLIRRGDGDRVYDYYASRILFPIRDPKGRVVGFGGRSLDGSEPKYINTAETKIFGKAKLLYGLDVARNAIRRSENAYLTEGYTDVLMAQINGIDETVAVLGTAVGAAHGQMLRRYTPRVTVVFDADDAGRKALHRSAEHFMKQDLDIFVIELPKGQDLCSFVKDNGKDAFDELAQKAERYVSFALSSAVDDAERMEVARRLLAVTATLSDPIKKDAIIVEIDRHTAGLSLESLRTTAAANSKSGGSAPPVTRSGRLRHSAERHVLEAVLSGKVSLELLVSEFDTVVTNSLEDSTEGRILQRVASLVASSNGEDLSKELLAKAASEPERALIVRLSSVDDGLDYEELFRFNVGRIKGRAPNRVGAALKRKMRDALAKGDGEQADALLREYNQLKVASVGSKED